MINLLTLILNSKVVGPGGLFDLDATLFFVIIQFLILMVCLNEILYNPIQAIMDERQAYIVEHLNETSGIIRETDRLTLQYENMLDYFSGQTQIEIKNAEEFHKKILKVELGFAKDFMKNWLENTTKAFILKQSTTVENLDNILLSLYTRIEPKLIYLKSLPTT